MLGSNKKFYSLNRGQKEIAQKSIRVFLIRIIGYLFGFFFTWIVANQYGPKTQGIFSIAYLFLVIGVMISKLGFETSIVKWVASSTSIEEQKQYFLKTIRVVFLTSLLVSTLLYFFSPHIALMYNKKDIEISIQIASFGIPFFAILDVSSNFFKGQSRTSVFALYFHLAKFLLPAIFLVLLYFLGHLSFSIPIISYTLGLFLLMLLILLHLYKELRNIKSIDLHLPFKQMLNESYPMLIASSIVMVMGWSDIFILGFYTTEDEIGVYSTAVKLATLVSFTYNAIATIVTPKIAYYFSQNNIGKFTETIQFSAKIMLLVSLPPFLILMVFPEFFLAFFGEEYIAGKTVLRILLIAQFSNVITGPVGPIFQMTNKQHELQKFILVSLIFNILFSLILVRFYNLIGVAIGSALGMFLWNFLGAIYIFHKMKIRTWYAPFYN